METGKYRLVDWIAANETLAITTDGGPLTVTKNDVVSGEVTLMVDDQRSAVHVEPAYTVVLAHPGAIANMRSSLGLPTL